MFVEGTLVEKLRKLDALHAGTQIDASARPRDVRRSAFVRGCAIGSRKSSTAAPTSRAFERLAHRCLKERAEPTRRNQLMFGTYLPAAN